MSYNEQIYKYKKKYEKRHDTEITVEEARFLYFKRDQKTTVFIFLSVAILAVGIMVWAYFTRPTETPLPYIFGIVIAILCIMPSFAYKKNIRKYMNLRKKPERIVVLTRELLADNPSSSFNSKSITRWGIKAGIPMVIFLILGVIYMDSEDRWWAFLPAIACLILVLSAVYLTTEQRNIRNKIYAGDFMLFSATLNDINVEFGIDENSQDYGKFCAGMPLGEGYTRLVPTHGYYSLVNVGSDNVVVGMRYYLLLMKTKEVDRNGEAIYKLQDMFSEDFYTLDEDLRTLVITK